MDNKNLSIKELKKICLKDTEDFIVYYFYRNISIRITKLIVNTKITANQVTYFSFFLAMFSAIFFMLGGYTYLLIGVLLYNFSFIFDNVDGELVRYRNYLNDKVKESYSQLGIWLDTTFDILGAAIIFIGVTLGLYNSTGYVNMLIIGFLATVNMLIMYTFIVRRYQRVKEYREFKFGGGKFFIGSGCAITVTLTLSALFNNMYYFLLFWAVVGFLIWVKQFFTNYRLFKNL